MECLAALGLVRGLPEVKFHARVSELRDRAEEAGRGFLSAEVRLVRRNASDRLRNKTSRDRALLEK